MYINTNLRNSGFGFIYNLSYSKLFFRNFDEIRLFAEFFRISISISGFMKETSTHL